MLQANANPSDHVAAHRQNRLCKVFLLLPGIQIWDRWRTSRAQAGTGGAAPPWEGKGGLLYHIDLGLDLVIRVCFAFAQPPWFWSLDTGGTYLYWGACLHANKLHASSSVLTIKMINFVFSERSYGLCMPDSAPACQHNTVTTSSRLVLASNASCSRHESTK